MCQTCGPMAQNPHFLASRWKQMPQILAAFCHYVGRVPNAAALEWQSWQRYGAKPALFAKRNKFADKQSPVLLMCAAAFAQHYAAAAAAAAGWQLAFKILEGFERQIYKAIAAVVTVRGFQRAGVIAVCRGSKVPAFNRPAKPIAPTANRGTRPSPAYWQNISQNINANCQCGGRRRRRHNAWRRYRHKYKIRRFVYSATALAASRKVRFAPYHRRRLACRRRARAAI